MNLSHINAHSSYWNNRTVGGMLSSHHLPNGVGAIEYFDFWDGVGKKAGLMQMLHDLIKTKNESVATGFVQQKSFFSKCTYV